MKKPAAGFPYVPGGDVCGVVEEVSGDGGGFSPGDVVVGSWTLCGEGGLAEYHAVEASLVARKPRNVSPIVAAAAANSLVHATQIADLAAISPGDRVLVLGGGGGVGTSLVQIVKARGAAYVAATSTDCDLMTRLGVDRCIDYTREDWMAEFRSSPLDVVVDCAEGEAAWFRVADAGLVKPARRGGRFVAVVPRQWNIVMTRITHVLFWFLPVVGRLLRSRLFARWSDRPRYRLHLGGVETGADIARALALVDDGRVAPVVDTRSAHPLTTAGVRDAFDILRQRKGHGKIVIQVADA